MNLDTASRLLAVACLEVLLFAVFWLFRGADTPFLAFAVIGVVVVQLSERPRRGDLLAALAAGSVVGYLYLAGGRSFGSFTAAVPVGCLAFLGLGSLAILGARAVVETRALRPLLLAAFCPLLMAIVNFALLATVEFQPKVFDHYLYRFDAQLGGQAAFQVGRWLGTWPALQAICFLVYSALPLAAVVFFLLYLHLRDRRRFPANAFVVFLIAGAAGFSLFWICPAVGPRHVYGDAFPVSPPRSVPLEAIPLEAFPRNAMPSLHAAWALLIWWNLRGQNRWIRRAVEAFLAFTLLATLGFGEHYLIDLVVAIPFSLAIQASAEKRRLPASAGALLAIAWVVALRLGWIPPSSVAWTAAALTLGASALALSGMTTPRAVSHNRITEAL